jgi:UDP-N-acetyl-D-mannosaminuronic acid dehydrogenase
VKITVIGLGYIGLPTALLLSKTNHKVIGYDLNFDLVERLKLGNINELDDEIRGFFDDDSEVEFKHEIELSDIYIVCVPTPIDPVSKKFDSQPLLLAINNIISIANKDSVVVIESTIPPGTIDNTILPLLANSLITKVAHCPERVMPGNMKHELIYNSRIIGTNDFDTGVLLQKLYGSFTKGEIITTSIIIAELSKVVENSYRDVNIAFANSIALVCASLKIDSKELISVANLHPRVNILRPGPGVGGHCIPVDPWFLITDFPNETRLLKQAREINDFMPQHIVSRILEIVQLEGITINRVGFYGLSYKANTKDFRESPSLAIIDSYEEFAQTTPKIFDPFLVNDKISILLEFKSFVNSVDLVVVLVDHDHLIENIDLLRNKIIFDTRSMDIFKTNYKL